MSITASDVDFGTILSLDRAVLVKRDRLNYLGSKELTLDYKLQTSGAKELCADWLVDNRLSITDPTFSFKTYEGTWQCVDISFNEDTKSIRQRFKVDSSLVNDVAQRDASGDTLRSYYWKIVNPADYNVPATAADGVIWTKNVNDNGDGTYDVTITKRTDEEGALTSEGWAKTALYSEETDISINSAAIPEPAQTVGKTIRVSNTPLENGLFRTETTTRTAIAVRVPAFGSITWFNDGRVDALCYLVSGRNQPYTQFQIDYNANKNIAVTNTFSIDVNEFGLYDYTLRGRT